MATNSPCRRSLCNEVPALSRSRINGSDICSFLVQMSGAILLLGKTDTEQRARAGQNTLMAGLAINFASFCIFFTLMIWYEVVTRRIVRDAGLKRTYAPIIGASMVSQFFLIVRSAYRVVEFQQGFFSRIATTEIYFYIFDTMLMIFATAIYILLFPPAFGLLGKKSLTMKVEEARMVSIEMGRQREEIGHRVGLQSVHSDDTHWRTDTF